MVASHVDAGLHMLMHWIRWEMLTRMQPISCPSELSPATLVLQNMRSVCVVTMATCAAKVHSLHLPPYVQFWLLYIIHIKRK